MSKYPQFERVGSGKLREGDRILVRDGWQDSLALDGAAGPAFHGREQFLAPGQYTVMGKTYLLGRHSVGSRRTGRYFVTVANPSGQFTVSLAPVHRVNRVIR